MTTVDLYLLTAEKVARLTRDMPFERLPVPGEWVRLKPGRFSPHRVTEVVHEMDGTARVVLGPDRDEAGRWIQYDSGVDFNEDISTLKSDGWQLVSTNRNTRHVNEA
jgi:hypothetical protein